MKLTWPVSGHPSQEWHQDGHHPGIDIPSTGSGTPVDAAGDGTVIWAGPQTGYGNFVVIDHGNGIQTAYAHLSSIGVRVGDTVTDGQVIGAEGSTGFSTGPHVHFEVRENGHDVNPRKYLGMGDPVARSGPGGVPGPDQVPTNTAPGGPGSTTSSATQVTDPGTATRLGLIVLGALIVLVAVFVMFRNGGGISDATGNEAKPAGRHSAE